MKSQLCVIVLMSVAMLSVSAIAPAYAPSGMSMDVSPRNGGAALTVSGESTKTDAISIIIKSPQQNVVFTGQTSPDANGMFSFNTTLGAGWAEDGIYTVNVKQKESSLYNLSLNISVAGGAVTSESMSKSSLPATNILAPSRDSTERAGLVFTADAQPGANMIVLDGSTSSLAHAITVLVTSPTGNIIHTDQLSPSASGDFNTVINLGCPQWQEDGDYEVAVQQGSSSLFRHSEAIEVSECLVVPEFGTIAMLILAVSIVAIIAASARTRMGIMPRY